MAEEIETLTLNDILGPRTVNTPTCQICGESLYTPDLLPVEITTCRHRFHRLCLQDWCNNNNRYNNHLENCTCPECLQSFNFNIRLRDLTQLVNARRDQLEGEAQGLQAAQAVGQAVGQAVVQAPAVAQANNLQIYTQQNYLIDRATRRFSDCLPRIEGRSIHDDSKRIEWVERQIVFINSIVTNFKFNALYAEQIRRILPIINRINDNLQNQDFITRLLARRVLPNGYPDKQSWFNTYVDESNPLTKQYNGNPNSIYDGYVQFFSVLLLQGCYTGETRGRYEIPAEERANFNPLHDPPIINLFKQMFHSYLLWETEAKNGVAGNTIVKVYEVVPPSNVLPDLNARPIEIGFFQRYFQCFLDFLTALLEVNYNQAFQLQGGKRSRGKRSIRKTRKQRKNKKMRKTKVKGKK
jgi:hypothetical protein